MALVPVDVRVLDRDDNPIPDLTAADFTVLDNGVPQTISHFSTNDVSRAGLPEFRRRDGKNHEVVAEVRIAPDAVHFVEQDRRHIASLDVALYVGARNERQIGELRRRVDLRLRPENYARVLQEGVIFSSTVTATGEPRYVKAIVYEYVSDRLGSVIRDLRR